MNTQTKQARPQNRSLLSFGICALLAVGAATAQVAGAAGTGATGIDNSGSYQQEVQACMSGKTQQSQADCLKEARNAHADKARGVLLHEGENFQANAMQRCATLSGEDKAACQARMMGYGSVEGTVAGGGVIREVETVVLPSGQSSVTVQPQTESGPVVLMPSSK